MYKRRQPQRDDLLSEPTIIALADITLCLLVIVLSAGAAGNQFAAVALPEASNVSARDSGLAVTITVTKAGKFLFEDEKDEKNAIEGKNLWTALRDIKGDSNWSMAMIRADKDAPVEAIYNVTHCCQGLGVDEVSYVMKDSK